MCQPISQQIMHLDSRLRVEGGANPRLVVECLGSGLDTTGITDPSTSLPAQTTPPPEATTPPTTSTTPPTAEATQPAVPQTPVQPTEPLTAGTGGGATAAP